MKIVQVIPAFLPSRHYGGGPGVVAALAREQTRLGHQVTVVTTDALDERARVLGRESERDGYRVTYAPNISNRLAYRQKIFLSRGLLAGLPEGLRGWDVAHLHDYRTVQNVVTARAARAAGVPYVIQAHGALNTTSGKGAVKRAFDAVWGRRILQGAAACLALNDTEAAAYRALGVPPQRVRLLPNGIDRAVADAPPGAAGSFRKQLGLEEGTALILYAGRVHPSKSVDLLVDAFAALAREEPRLVLAIVGPDDGDAGRLRRQVEGHGLGSRVRFVGFVDEETKWSAYRDADVVVIPSFYGFPLVILEAWAVAAPVVVTSRHERLSFLAETGGAESAPDAAALAATLRPFLADPEHRRRVGERGRAAVRASYTWPAIARQVVAIYEEVTA